MNRRTALLGLLILVLGSVPVSRLSAQADKKEVPEPSIKVGDEAPDFTLIDQNGNKVTLSSYRGKKNVALAFYVFAFTGG